ncbi:WD40/YVTN/BNR-like repeat-containing protein, partial [Pseudomonas guariconensis]|uniref:WD40/YVTN/BNR-like repeat-containing protein n=2 Tax=Pseudomonas guariconensis TaxID=1288410 RepID=UPI002D1EB897
NDTAQQVHADAIYAATSATNAADSASAANAAKLAAQQAVTAAEQAGAEQLALAVAARDEAEAFAEAAGAGVPAERTPFTVLQVNAAGQVAWGYGLPDRTNAKVGQSLMLGAGKVPGFGWAGDQVGDILQTLRAPDSTYLACDGSVRMQSAYPQLFAQTGLLGGNVGQSFPFVSTPVQPTATIVKGQGDIALSISSGGGCIRSTDKGKTWSALTLTASGVSFTLTALATNGEGRWVGMTGLASPNRVAISTDNGSTWSLAALPLMAAGEGSYAAAVIHVGGAVWICFKGNSTLIARSTDGGVTWGQVSNSVTSPVAMSINANSVASDGAGTVVIAMSGRWLRSTDFAANFYTLTAPMGG